MGKTRLRVGLLTTLGTNIGDDLIRRGIIHVLRRAWGNRPIEFVAVNKHHPYSVYPRAHPLRWTPRARTRLARALSPLGMSRFDGCDLLVQCGAPVLWPDCHQCEWAVPVWTQVIGRLHRRIPVANVAAGSCYPWERQPTRVESARDAEFLQRIASYCRVTTVRDALAEKLYSDLGAGVERVVCSAFLSADATQLPRQPGDTVLINFMEGGGHYGWDQSIDPGAWRQTIRELIRRLECRHSVVMLCHDEREVALATEIAPHLRRVLPRSVEEYFEVVRRAKTAICNRMHASVALASIGVPSIAVCTDTRLLMVDELGLPAVYVKSAEADLLEGTIERFITAGETERERLLLLKEETRLRYESILGSLLGNRSASGSRTPLHAAEGSAVA